MGGPTIRGWRHSECEHLQSDHLWDSGRNRLLGDACCADLGLEMYALNVNNAASAIRRPALLCACSPSRIAITNAIVVKNIRIVRRRL